MSTALEYLGDLPLYWINLDRSKERRQHMFDVVEPLFLYGSERIDAIEGYTVSELETDQFVTNWQVYWEENRDQLTYANRPPGDRFRMGTQKANIAIRRSHLKALRHGILNEQARFVVAEDDIMPRSTLFSGEVPLPPADADVAIWSGGLPMAGVGHDSDLFEAGRPHRWVRVKDSFCFNALGAGCYEVSNAAAHHLIDRAGHVPMSWDHAWGAAFQRLTVYRLRPNAFAQVGPSVRNGKVREPTIERKSA